MPKMEFWCFLCNLYMCRKNDVKIVTNAQILNELLRRQKVWLLNKMGKKYLPRLLSSPEISENTDKNAQKFPEMDRNCLKCR